MFASGSTINQPQIQHSLTRHHWEKLTEGRAKPERNEQASEEAPYPNRASSTCLCIFPDVLRGSASIATKCTSLGSL